MNLTVTESDKKLLSFLAAFLLAGIFFLAVFRPLMEKNNALQKEIEVARQEEVNIDTAASLAEDMASKEQTTKEQMLKTMQCFYPILESQEAENMVTILMLNHNLQVQNLSIVMSEVPSGLKWYQYSENAVTTATAASENNPENNKPEDSFGVYTIRINCTADGTKENLMALLDDISMNYPAISILSAEWSGEETQTSVVKVPVAEKTEEAETEDAEQETVTVQNTVTKNNSSLTIGLEIYMCNQ